MTTVFNSWTPVIGCGVVPTAGGGGQATFQTDLLPISVVNTLPSLSQSANGNLILLIVNGRTFTPVDGSFSVNGTVLQWLSAIFAVNPGDTVVAVYTYG